MSSSKKFRSAKDLKVGGAVKSMTQNEFALGAGKKNIIILEELEALIPPQSEEEHQRLTESIRTEGVQEALVLWQRGNELVLVDGHNRYRICKNLGITDYPTQTKQFADIEAVKDYMISLQLSRRNLTKNQASYLRGLQYNREKKKVGENQHTTPNSGENILFPPQKTADAIAEKYGMSHMTIKRDEQYALGIELIGEYDLSFKRSLLSGQAKANKSAIQKLHKAENIKEAVQQVIAPAPVRKPKTSTFQKKKNQFMALMKAFEEDSNAEDRALLRARFEELVGE